MLWKTVTGILSFAAVIVALEINDGVCMYRKYERAGDVKFLVVAGIRERDGQGACGKSSRSIFEQIVALEWIVSLLNGNGSRGDSFIPGISIGYDIYDNCDNEDLTTDLLYSGQLASHDMDCSSPSTDDTVYISAISLTTPRATNTMARLHHQLPVLRPLVSSPTLETRDQKNLIQSVPSFNQEATAIVKMLSSLGWNFVVVVHTEDAAEEALTFSAIAHANAICVSATGTPDTNTVQKIFSTINRAYDKSLAVIYFGGNSGAEFMVKESTYSRPYGSMIHWIFTSHFANNIAIENLIQNTKDSITTVFLHNDVDLNEYRRFYNDISENSPLQSLIQKYNFGVDISAPRSNPYPMVDAVLSAINSVKHVWDTVCGQGTAVDNCTSFKDAIKSNLFDRIRLGVNIPDKVPSRYLPAGYNRSLNYQQDGSQVYNTIFYKMNITSKYQTIGSFTRNEFKPTPHVFTMGSSACNLECTECQQKLNLRYSYLHGDYLILGLFSVRQYGGSPFSCGPIRRGTNDIVTVSSFFHSVLERRNVTGINFGAIAIDDCYNGLNTSYYLAKLFSKQSQLSDPSDKNRVINFDNVIAIVGALSSSVSLIVADLSTFINIPMISYGASSPDLDNKRRYPYFLRTVPSDTLQVQGMVSMLERLDVTHVGLLYIDDAYGQGGKMQLLEEISSRNICVQNPMSVRQDMPENYIRQVITELYNQQVRVVLLFVIDSVAQQILEVVKGFIQRSFPPLVFISSEGWGSNLNLLTRSSLGSIVFNIAAQSYNSNQYRSYLKTLRPWLNQENRWLSRYFEDFNHCDNLTSFEKTFIERNEPRICGNAYKSVLDTNTTKSLSEDQRYFHTMLSVYAVTNGYKKFCDEETSCSPLAVKNRPSEFFAHIKSTKYGDNIPVFDEDGNGHIGFTIHNIQLKRNSGIYFYERIGNYQKNGKLHLTAEPKFYNDVQNEESLKSQYKTGLNCLYVSDCSEVCPLPDVTKSTTEKSVVETTTSSDKNDSSLMAMTILFGVFMAILFVALIFVVVILVRIQRRQAKQLSDRSESAGHTVSMSDERSVYDEPGSVKRKGQFDNIAFLHDSASLHSAQHTPSTMMKFGGSVSALNMQQPVQYAHIRQRSNPDISIHHVRQVSNQELRSQWFDSLERPMSTLSAPAYKPQFHNQRSPFDKRNIQQTGAKQKAYQQTYSPKTPHSAPTGFGQKRTPQVYRPRAQSSPRFRYPSSSGEESHYATPKLNSSEEISPQRKMGVSNDDIHEHFDDNEEPNLCNADSYLCPHSGSENGSQNQPESEHKITYITAKDLVTSENEDEEECSSHSAIQYVLPESQNFFTAQVGAVNSDNLPKPQSIPSMTSPTDNEVKEINFPPSDKSFRRIQSNDSLERDKSTSRNIALIQPQHPNNQASTGSEQERAVAYHKNNSRNSITDVPDVIKHGAYEEDGVFII